MPVVVADTAEDPAARNVDFPVAVVVVVTLDDPAALCIDLPVAEVVAVTVEEPIADVTPPETDGTNRLFRGRL
jgi:hypothetical protein